MSSVLRVVDDLVGSVAGRPLRLRLALGPGLVAARTPRVSVVVGDVAVGGLRLERVHIRAQDVQLVPGVPPRIRAAAAEVGVVAAQDAVDRWSAAVGLPARLRFRDGAVLATTGLGGLRLGQLEVGVALRNGLVWLVPKRVGILGVSAAAPRQLALPLPLPPLPRSARLAKLAPSEGRLEVGLVLESVDEPLTAGRLRAVRALLSR